MKKSVATGLARPARRHLLCPVRKFPLERVTRSSLRVPPFLLFFQLLAVFTIVAKRWTPPALVKLGVFVRQWPTLALLVGYMRITEPLVAACRALFGLFAQKALLYKKVVPNFERNPPLLIDDEEDDEEDDDQYDDEDDEMGGPKLTRGMLQNFPCFNLSSTHSLLLQERTCSICLEPWAVGDSCRFLLCGHRFHSRCVDTWLLDHKATCPLCRECLIPEAEFDS